MAEKFIESLDNAQKALQIADHMTYVTFPLIKEKRLLLKVLAALGICIPHIINAILQYEYYWKRIQIYKEAKDNFETFRRISARYDITAEQLKKIVEILTLAEKHKKSPFEFVRNDKIIIMSESMQTDTLTIEKIKTFLLDTKDFFKKATTKIRGTQGIYTTLSS